jgi:3-hydroxymyristoyl/3-hydroxydecanoyl-(acyl carrier protein) dehydratase
MVEAAAQLAAFYETHLRTCRIYGFAGMTKRKFVRRVPGDRLYLLGIFTRSQPAVLAMVASVVNDKMDFETSSAV